MAGLNQVHAGVLKMLSVEIFLYPERQSGLCSIKTLA
jgi:hypothetical protein